MIATRADARGPDLPGPAAPRDMWLLVGAFTVSGLLHLATPARFEAIVPRRLPAKRRLVYASGLLELGCAAGMSRPATRRVAGVVSAGLLAAIFPANVQMTLDLLRGRSRLAKILAVARLPLQLPLIWIALRAACSGARTGMRGPVNGAAEGARSEVSGP